MELSWDYTPVAKYTTAWGPYPQTVLEAIQTWANLGRGKVAVDMGAGWGRMTVPLAAFGAKVHAVEPNPTMRGMGEKAYAALTNIEWHKTRGEQTGLRHQSADCVVFSSSLHTMDPQKALWETGEILKEGGWIILLSTHRNLNDPFQYRIEEMITGILPGFSYGAVKQDWTQHIGDAKRFLTSQRDDFEHSADIPKTHVIRLFRGDLNLARQAKDKLERVLAGVQRVLDSVEGDTVPYSTLTRLWVARR